MEYSKVVEHRYNVDNLHLDAGEMAALKKALPGNGEGWFDIYEYANAWAKSLLLDGASDLAINEHGDEPGDAWLITRATDESKALHFFYSGDSTGEEWLRGGKVYFFRRKRTND